MHLFSSVFEELELVLANQGGNSAQVLNIDLILSVYGKILVNSFAIQSESWHQIGRAVYLGWVNKLVGRSSSAECIIASKSLFDGKMCNTRARSNVNTTNYANTSHYTLAGADKSGPSQDKGGWPNLFIFLCVHGFGRVNSIQSIATIVNQGTSGTERRRASTTLGSARSPICLMNLMSYSMLIQYNGCHRLGTCTLVGARGQHWSPAFFTSTSLCLLQLHQPVQIHWLSSTRSASERTNRAQAKVVT